jgi:hypothetical protein
MFQNSSSPAFVSMQFGKLSELDALGNSIPVHTITTLAALKPEVTSGEFGTSTCIPHQAYALLASAVRVHFTTNWPAHRSMRHPPCAGALKLTPPC